MVQWNWTTRLSDILLVLETDCKLVVSEIREENVSYLRWQRATSLYSKIEAAASDQSKGRLHHLSRVPDLCMREDSLMGTRPFKSLTGTFFWQGNSDKLRCMEGWENLLFRDSPSSGSKMLLKISHVLFWEKKMMGSLVCTLWYFYWNSQPKKEKKINKPLIKCTEATAH